MRRAFLYLIFFLSAVAPALGAAGGIAVKGRVLGPGGAPLAGARITVRPVEGERERGERLLESKPEPAPVAETKTGAGGSFALTAPAGFWTLRVEVADQAPQERNLFPLIEESELPAVTLAADRPLEVEVVDAGGRPLPAAWVKAEPSSATAAWREERWRPAERLARRGDAGPPRVQRAAAESLTVRAFAPGLREAEAEVRPGQRTITLRLAAAAPPGPVEVRDAAGRPVAGALVVAGKGQWPIGLTDAGGRLAAALPVGDGEEVSAWASGGRRGSTRLQPPPPGAIGESPAAVITLPAAGALAGRVLDAQRREPLPGALVWWSGEPATAARTDGAGAYRLAGVRAGRAGIAAAAPGYLAGFASLTVAAGEGRGPTFALKPAVRLRGRVVDAASKAPLAGVELRAAEAPEGASRGIFRFSDDEAPVARTGADGRFEVRGLAAETQYALRLAREGYAPRTAPVPPVAPGAAPPPLELTLDRGRRAVGRVLDAEERPVAGAAITLRPAPANQNRFQSLTQPEEEPFRASAGAGGEFAFTGLPPGRFDLEARAPGFAPRLVPGIEVPAGPGEHDLGTVLLSPGVALEGKVSDPQGRPIPQAEVRVVKATGRMALLAMFRRGEEEPDAWSRADGSFRIADLAPGQPVNLVVTHKGFGGADVPQVTPPSEPLAVTLHPALRIAGRVVDPDGDPVARARLMLSTEWQRGGSRAMRSSGQTESDEQGRFLFEDVEPGTLRLTASAEGRQSAELGGIAAAPGKDVEGLELVLAPGATVEGRVTDAAGRPVPDVMVQVLDEERAMGSRIFHGTRADGDGWYTIEGLPSGQRSLAAEDDQGRRAVGDLDVRPGSNRLDLRFRGGVELAGRVLDADGNPVPAAEVELAGSGVSWGRQQVATGADGAFLLQDVEDGEYRLLVSKEGYASGESDPLKVAGAPLLGLEVRLQGGGAVTGRVLGLEPEALPRVEVRAFRLRGTGYQSKESRVDYEGRYRLPALAAGEWQVRAELPGSGRQAEGRVTLEPGAAEAVLDLDFGTGFTLAGRVTRGRAPVAGAVVDVAGKDVADHGSADTDREGSFRITGLDPGTYEVSVHAGSAQLRQEVALQGDREVALELEVAAVAGRVVETTGRAPVAGAAVSLQPAVAGEQWWLDASTVNTDSQGRFRLAEVGEGRWRLRVEREGYGAADRELEVRGGIDVEELEIALEPTSGLVLEVVRAAGGAPTFVVVAVLNASGRTVAGGFQQTGEGGRVRLSTVPPGTYEVLVQADGLAVGRAVVVVPGPPVRLALDPEAVLDLRVPALEGGAALAKVTLRAADGTPFRTPGWTGAVVEPEQTMARGRERWEGLPAGSWTVEVRAADGRAWRGAATLVPGQTAELVLE
jgi:protocatechuate 3,4-dioxygenase beta subunit